MSTTVTYKGQTLTTVENQTKTLNTAGTWVEGDFTLTDVTQGGGGEWTTEGLARGTEPNGAIDVNGAINDFAFYKRTGITSITGATQIGQYACSGCTSLTSFDTSNFDGIIYSRAFEECTALTSFSSNGTGAIRNYAFYKSGLTEVNVPFAASVGNAAIDASAFRDCKSLVRAFLSRAAMNANNSYQNSPASLFQGCSVLEVADIGWLAANQWKSLFTDCPNLRVIIARGATKVPALSAWSLAAFGGVYSNPTQSTIYIPKALYDHLGDGTALDFQSATNWSTAYAAGLTFLPIEGSEYEL